MSDPAARSVLAAGLASEVTSAQVNNLRAAVEAVGSEMRWITEPQAVLVARKETEVALYDGRFGRDYALLSLGASIHLGLTSDAYIPPGAPSDFKPQPPESILDPDMHPGRCWCFAGSSGSVGIVLPRRLRITGISVDHIPRTLATHIESAPRQMRALGLSSDHDTEGAVLNTWMFDIRPGSDASQYFPISPDNLLAQRPFSLLRVFVDSNWGFKYTCLYRIRVHGEPAN